jgi:hypothetical protein
MLCCSRKLYFKLFDVQGRWYNGVVILSFSPSDADILEEKDKSRHILQGRYEEALLHSGEQTMLYYRNCSLSAASANL